MTISVQDTLDLLPEPSFILSRDAIVLYGNRAFEALLGRMRTELVGRPLSSLVTTAPEELAAVLHRWSGTLNFLPGALEFLSGNGTPIRLRCDGAINLRADGEARVMLVRCRPHQQSVEEFNLLNQRILQLDKEIMSRRRAEVRARASEERLRLAIESADMGIYDYDVLGDRLTCTERYRQMFGHQPGRDLTLQSFLARVHPDDVKHVQSVVEGVLDPTGSGEFVAEYRVIHGETGDERWFYDKGRAVVVGARAVRVTGVVLDITERRRAAEHQRLLINELNHRVKNTLATIQSIAGQTARHATSFEAFRQAFDTRLIALSNTHDLLTQTNWTGTNLRDLIETELAPYLQPDSDRLEVDGPLIHLPPKATISLGLILHELTTNAVKYGALSNSEGRINIFWQAAIGNEGRELELRWVERGGPKVEAPKRRGFGSRLIQWGLAYELSGRVELSFNPLGVECVMHIPMQSLGRADS